MLLSLLMSLSVEANEMPRCLIVLMGGGFQPGTRDIAEQVYNQALAEAQKTNCRVVSSANQNSTQFLAFIRGLRQNIFPGITVHLSFVGHGSARGETAQDGYVVSGYGRDNWTRNSDFVAALRDTFPAGTRITYSTNNCYPRWHELMLTTGMTERFHMCGVSSADPSTTSMNFFNTFAGAGHTRGSYTPMGFMRVNEDIRNRRTPTTLSMFHHHARIGDSNTLHNPGTSSSVFYANRVLEQRRDRTAVPLTEKFLAPILGLLENAPSAQWVRYAGADRATMKREVENLIRVSLIDGRSMTFRPVDDRGVFGAMMVNFARQLTLLSQVDPRGLPMPASQASQTARNYFHQNAPLIAEWITDIVIQAATFARDGGNEASWNPRRRQLLSSLYIPVFHLRSLQEALVVQKFLGLASDEQSVKFRTLLGCENLPMLSTNLPTDFSPEDWNRPGIRRPNP